MFSFATLALLFADNLPNKTNAFALVRLWRPPCANCCCKVACRSQEAYESQMIGHAYRPSNVWQNKTHQASESECNICR